MRWAGRTTLRAGHAAVLLAFACLASGVAGCSSGGGKCLNPQPLPPFCGLAPQPLPPAGPGEVFDASTPLSDAHSQDAPAPIDASMNIEGDAGAGAPTDASIPADAAIADVSSDNEDGGIARADR